MGAARPEGEIGDRRAEASARKIQRLREEDRQTDRQTDRRRDYAKCDLHDRYHGLIRDHVQNLATPPPPAQGDILFFVTVHGFVKTQRPMQSLSVLGRISNNQHSNPRNKERENGEWFGFGTPITPILISRPLGHWTFLVGYWIFSPVPIRREPLLFFLAALVRATRLLL